MAAARAVILLRPRILVTRGEIPRQARHNLIIRQRHDGLESEGLFVQTVPDSKDVSGGYAGCARAEDLCKVRTDMAAFLNPLWPSRPLLPRRRARVS